MPYIWDHETYENLGDMPLDGAIHYLRIRHAFTNDDAISWWQRNATEAAKEAEMLRKKGGKKNTNPVARFLNTATRYCIGGRGAILKEGELFGLELELEGKNLNTPKMPSCPGWTPHADGSLRGESNIEWIFNGPATYDISKKRIERLFTGLKKSGAKLQNSYRTSTHVHLNYSDKFNYQVVTLFILYTILEDVLAKWCGEHRSGNLFCLGARDAENLVQVMEQSALRYENFAEFNNELRYAGLNMSSLNKFGSVELRTMRGVDTAQEALDWLEICNDLYQFTLHNTKSPAELIEDISRLGARGFIYEILGKNSATMLTEKMSENELHMSVYDGVRLIQMLAYTISENWDIQVEYKSPDVKMEDDKEEASPKKKVAPFRRNANAPAGALAAELDRLARPVARPDRAEEPWAIDPRDL